MGDLYIEYEALSANYGGWNLTEIKDMPMRERRHWLSMIIWRREKHA